MQDTGTCPNCHAWRARCRCTFAFLTRPTEDQWAAIVADATEMHHEARRRCLRAARPPTMAYEALLEELRAKRIVAHGGARAAGAELMSHGSGAGEHGRGGRMGASLSPAVAGRSCSESIVANERARDAGERLMDHAALGKGDADFLLAELRLLRR